MFFNLTFTVYTKFYISFMEYLFHEDQMLIRDTFPTWFLTSVTALWSRQSKLVGGASFGILAGGQLSPFRSVLNPRYFLNSFSEKKTDTILYISRSRSSLNLTCLTLVFGNYLYSLVRSAN